VRRRHEARAAPHHTETAERICRNTVICEFGVMAMRPLTSSFWAPLTLNQRIELLPGMSFGCAAHAESGMRSISFAASDRHRTATLRR